MKLSAAGGSMTDSCEPEVVPPNEGNSETILQDLYINLCNLIVDSRIPGINERGYGDGCHCPPLMGPNTHKCDLSKLECQKHQKLIHHLLRAARSNVFEIDVLMLPDCCSEPKLSERLQNKEYVLLERWSMNCINCNGQSNIDVSQLLRAVRSFLHFSQISAWLSSTKGKSPANIYYWVKPSTDGSIEFEREPEVHSFPFCKINEDFYGCVTVKYPARTQYVPIIPCSKHPPLRTYSFRTIENSNLCPTIPLNPQLVRQLQISCDTTTQSTPLARTYVPDPAALILSPVSIIKTLSGKVSEGNISNRILKRSNCQSDLISAPDITLDLSKSKNIDVISKSQTSFVVCNYTQTCPQIQSHEKVSYRKRQLAMHLQKKGLKLRKLNADIPTPDSLQPTSNVCNISVERITSENENCDAPFHASNAKPVPLRRSSFENSSTSPVKDFSSNIRALRDQCKFLKKRKKRSKRKPDDNTELCSTLPHKKVRCDTQNYYVASSDPISIAVCPVQNIEASQVRTTTPPSVNSVSNLEQYNDQVERTPCEERQISFSVSSPNAISVNNNSKELTEIKTTDSESTNKHSFYLKRVLVNQSRNAVSSYNLHNVFLKSKRPYNKLRRKSFKVYKDRIPSVKLLTESPEMKLQENSLINKLSNSPKNQGNLRNEFESFIIERKNKGLSAFHPNQSSCEIVSGKSLGSNMKVETQVTEANSESRILKRRKISQKKSHKNRKSKSKLSHDRQLTHGKIKISSLTSQLDSLDNSSESNSANVGVSQSFSNNLGNTVQEECDTGYQDSDDHSSNNSTLKLTQILNQKATTKTVPFYHSSHAFRTLLMQSRNENLECFPKPTLKFPKSRKLLINFEESILKGCLPIVSSVDGFSAEIGASGSFCPNHLTLPANVNFYDLGNTNQGAAPYVAHVELSDAEYYLPKKGAVQVTLFNPSDTVVKMFVLNYDLSNMPPLCHTFIRQKIYYLPVSKEENPQKSLKWLRFIIHLRFASTKTGKIYLHKDFKIVVLNKSNDDAASEFFQEPRELRSFLSVPMNPTFSSI